jgi:hypothetical protein
MKKTYMKPALMVVRVQQQGIICTSVDSIDSNVGLDYGGGGSSPAHAPRYGGFDLDDYEW